MQASRVPHQYLGVQIAAVANNLGVLGVSLISPQQDAPVPPSEDGSDYSDRCVGQMNNLVHGMATAAGRVMALTTMTSRHVWLGLTALAKKDRDDLLGAPVATEGLFGSIASVTQRFNRLEVEKAQLSRMLPLAHPQAPPARGSTSGGGKMERETSGESPESALCLHGPSRGVGSGPTAVVTGRQNPSGSSSSGPHSGATAAEGHRVGSSLLQELTGGGRKRLGRKRGSLRSGREGKSCLLPL